jgi:SAM-dependent methyltransferase
MDDPGLKQRRAGSFGAVAELYDKVRPGYPIEAVSWMLPEGARKVVEIGAGTGALTRSLVELGLEVVAVEPDPRMREVLSHRLPSADVRAGRAEEIPVGDAEADAVVGGQMWHWVDLVPATNEAARVLRPDGVLGLVWNLRDESVDWMRELGSLFHSEDVHTGPAKVMLAPGAPFSRASSADFPFVQELDTAYLADFVASRSHVQVLEPGPKAQLLRRVTQLTQTHPCLAGRERIEIPYVTSCWRAIRD